MSPTLDRFWKLVRLATNNSNVEEARSAALKAVQMLVEQKLVVSDAQPVAQAAPPRPVRTSVTREDVLRDLYSKMQQREYAEWDRPYVKRPPPPPSRPDYASWLYDPRTDEYIHPQTGQRVSSFERSL